MMAGISRKQRCFYSVASAAHCILRFRTDSDIPGVEKLAVVAPGKAFLDFAWKPLDAISDAHSADLFRSQRVLHFCCHLLQKTKTGSFMFSSGCMLRPFSVAYVKGYRRSLTMLIVVQGIRELGIEPHELPYGFKDLWDIRMLQHAMEKCEHV